MRQLSRPSVDPIYALVTCVGGVTELVAREHYENNQIHLEDGIVDFESASQTVNWCSLPRVLNGNPNQVIVGTITKDQLIKLYSKHMVGASGSARQIYDDILVAANGKCPFCGGIGHTKTLDHYLPKANFPLYAIVPTNLVPCCRDCNSVKLAAFPSLAEEQPIHPYLDAPHFFLEKWTYATVVNDNPIFVQFEARPPDTWPAVDQQRVMCHFKAYDLASRYSIEAATGISELIHMRKTTFKGYSPEVFNEFVFELAQDPSTPINGWRRTFYSAIANTAWFSEVEF